jgi:Protein of unknown function (DUF3592)
MVASELLILLTLILCGLWTIRAVRYRMAKWQARNWPTTDGTVQKGQVVRGGPTKFQAFVYRSLLGYVYNVDGCRYAGLFVLIASDLETAEKLQKENEGKAVIVQYDPRQPQNSFLQEKELMGRQVIQNPLWIN